MTGIRLRLGLVDDQMIRPAQAARLLGVNRITLWRWARDGHIPKPIKLGPRVTAWPLHVLREFTRARANASGNACKPTITRPSAKNP